MAKGIMVSSNSFLTCETRASRKLPEWRDGERDPQISYVGRFFMQQLRWLSVRRIASSVSDFPVLSRL